MDDRNRAPDTRRPPFETQHIAGSSYRPAATPSPEKKDVAELGKPPLADRLTRPAATSASVPPPTQVSNKVLDERAKLREEAKKAEEALKRIKEEEERLDKLEAEKKAEAERKQKRDEEDRRRQIDERARDRERELWRSREDARRRDGLPSRPSRDDRGAFQDGRRSPVHAVSEGHILVIRSAHLLCKVGDTMLILSFLRLTLLIATDLRHHPLAILALESRNEPGHHSQIGSTVLLFPTCEVETLIAPQRTHQTVFLCHLDREELHRHRETLRDLEIEIWIWRESASENESGKAKDLETYLLVP